jgi:hypothetical protein
MAVDSLQVSVVSGTSGPVLVLAGEADLTSITRLDEALTAQVWPMLRIRPQAETAADRTGRPAGEAR